jgi:ActR/RegA family two-component response regulator
MRKVIVTGYPTLQNAVDAVNKGADAYIVKPFDVKKVLRTIQEQLSKQQTEKEYSQERVAEFIEARVRELDMEKEATQRSK